MDQLEGLGVLSLGDENLLLLFYQLIKNVIVQKKLNHVPERTSINIGRIWYKFDCTISQIKYNDMYQLLVEKSVSLLTLLQYLAEKVMR